MRSGLKNEREKSFPYQVLNRSPLEPKACVLTNELLFNFISKNVYWSSRYQLGNCLAKKIAWLGIELPKNKVTLTSQPLVLALSVLPLHQRNRRIGLKPGCHYCVNACVTGAMEKIENFLFFMHTLPLRTHIRSKIRTSHGGFTWLIFFCKQLNAFFIAQGPDWIYLRV